MCYNDRTMKNNSNKLILIVEDSADNQQLLEIILTSRGYQVQCASNGHEALEMLLELSILPNLILLDARMPVMDGYEFRALQSKNERIKNIPVLVMTGDSDERIGRQMNEPCAVLVKPLRLNSVIEAISLHI